MNHKILVVDDEEAILQMVRTYLEREGFAVETAVDGLSALEKARQMQPDLVVLDVMLPGLDGVEVCRQLRAESEVYILMLTARTEEPDKLIGLAVGADDYVTKPFSPRELVARVKAILRRKRGAPSAPDESLLRFPHFQIDPNRRQVWKDTGPVELTALEFNILHALAEHAGRVFTREQLLERVWGYDFYGDDRVVDVHIGQLRKKLEDQPSQPRFVKTVRGVGYKFEDLPDAP